MDRYEYAMLCHGSGEFVQMNEFIEEKSLFESNLFRYWFTDTVS